MDELFIKVTFWIYNKIFWAWKWLERFVKEGI